MPEYLADDAHAELEAQAYEAAVVGELLPSFLERIGQLSDTAGVALICLNDRGLRYSVSPSLGNLMERFIGEGWAERNTRAQGVIDRGLVGVPRFVTEADFLAPEDIERDPLINGFMRKIGLGWVTGFMVQVPHGDHVIFSVEQYYERGPVSGAPLARLNALYPVLARAATLGARVAFERVRTAIETLTVVGLPAVAVSARGKVILASALFAEGDHIWMTRGGDRLGLYDRVADQMLYQALGAIQSSDVPRSIPVRREIGGRAVAVLQIVPIRRAAHDIFGNAEAIVILSQPHDDVPDATLIHSLFDLTPAEIGVATAIARGETVSQIAAATGRTIGTIRGHLKSAMAKTGSTRQTELAILMGQLGRHAPARPASELE